MSPSAIVGRLRARMTSVTIKPLESANHRDWIYSLTVVPEHRGCGIGTRLARHAEEHLRLPGRPKIDLQIMAGNEKVEPSYRKLGHQTERRISECVS